MPTKDQKILIYGEIVVYRYCAVWGAYFPVKYPLTTDEIERKFAENKITPIQFQQNNEKKKLDKGYCRCSDYTYFGETVRKDLRLPQNADASARINALTDSQEKFNAMLDFAFREGANHKGKWHKYRYEDRETLERAAVWDYTDAYKRAECVFGDGKIKTPSQHMQYLRTGGGC